MGPISARFGLFQTERSILGTVMLATCLLKPTEALLVDESSADCVWEAWDRGEIDDVTAWWLWLIVVAS